MQCKLWIFKKIHKLNCRGNELQTPVGNGSKGLPRLPPV